MKPRSCHMVRLPSGHELFTGWAAVQMTVELGEPYVTGNGPAGRGAEIELVDPNGTLVASGLAYATVAGPGMGPGGPGGTQWTITLRDSLGADVAVRAHDTLRARVGDDYFELVVPELRGVAFVSDDLVNGHTDAGRLVTLRLTRPGSRLTASAEVVADVNGNFSQDFAGTFDIQHNDTALFTTREQGHVVNSRILVPGLRIDLDTATLTGSWRPDAEMLAELAGPSGNRASARITAVADVDDAAFEPRRRGVRGETERSDRQRKAFPVAVHHLRNLQSALSQGGQPPGRCHEPAQHFG